MGRGSWSGNAPGQVGTQGRGTLLNAPTAFAVGSPWRPEAARTRSSRRRSARSSSGRTHRFQAWLRSRSEDRNGACSPERAPTDQHRSKPVNVTSPPAASSRITSVQPLRDRRVDVGVTAGVADVDRYIAHNHQAAAAVDRLRSPLRPRTPGGARRAPHGRITQGRRAHLRSAPAVRRGVAPA